MKRGGAGWHVFLTLILLLCCSPLTADILRMGLAKMPSTLDPRFSTDAASSRVNRLLYRGLVDHDGQSRPLPDLAEWQQLSPRHYRFTLFEDNAPFSNGDVLTAIDVKATFDSILDPATASPHRGTLQHIESVSVVDPQHIDFHLQRADPLFPGLLDIGILPAKLIAGNHPFSSSPVGNGPFILMARPHDKALRLQRRSDGSELQLEEAADPTVRVLKLLHGGIDLLQNDLLPELLAYLEGDERFRLLSSRGTTFSYLGFNLEDPVSGNPVIRQAIAHAIDREAIIHYLFHDRASPADSVLAPGHWARAEGLRTYDHDPDEARRLLGTLGYGLQKPLAIEFKSSTDPFRLRLATIIQAQLAAVGIDMRIRSYEWGAFYGDIKAGRFQMYSLAWVGVKSPDILRYVFHSNSLPPQGANRGRYRNAQVDAWLAAAESNTDEAERIAAYGAVQRQVMEDLVYVPLWYEQNVAVAHRSLTGYRPGIDGNYDALATAKRVAADDKR